MFLMSGAPSTTTIRGSILAYFAMMTVVFLALFGWRHDMLTTQMWWHAIVLTPLYVGATWIGSRWFRQASEPIYRRVVLIFLTCLALIVLLY